MEWDRLAAYDLCEKGGVIGCRSQDEVNIGRGI
jgi:hypothetical protein